MPVGAKLTLSMLATLLTGVLGYRKAQKVLSTYVEPTEIDELRFAGYLHPIINVTATNTGRTSCSKPNLQNVPKNSLGNYRRCIVPRTPTKKLVEFDYKQLEVVALAVLSLDKQLMQDLIDGVDMHAALFQEVHGKLPNATERTDFKRAVFCLIYGGGVNAIADQGNTTPSKAKRLLQMFQARYPDTLRFREVVLDEVGKDSIVVAERKYGIPHRCGFWLSPTGRTYAFEQRLMDKHWPIRIGRTAHAGGLVTKTCDWSKQEIANYPIQGLATADMAPLMIGMLYRYIYSDAMGILAPTPLLLMAVHDSVLVELEESTIPVLVPRMKGFLEGLPHHMQVLFGMNCGGLPFKVGVSVGDNWEDLKDFNQGE
jgi:DNA polymerase I-like protein with 3'-5' exonuclease and polymerase domains